VGVRVVEKCSSAAVLEATLCRHSKVPSRTAIGAIG
jgi:hypothetical protein